MLEPNSLKKGVVFKYKNNPVQVIGFSHTHRGRGSAVVTVKGRDLITAAVQTFTFKAGDKLEEADMVRRSADFLYCDESFAHFMDTLTFEPRELEKDRIREKLKFMKEGATVTLLEFEEKPIDVELPPKVDLGVTETEPGIKGDTASGAALKLARLETGHELNVPLFIKQGDVIRVNTETEQYVERAGSGS
jgi:elongation factor P